MKSWDRLEADVNRILDRHYTPGRGGAKVNKVIVHYNAGNLTVEGCYSVWQTREASAHYQVEDDGRIGQLVWDSDTAWHAGDWNANVTSIGIEHANKSDGTITEECLDNGAHLVAACCKYFGLGRPAWLKNVFPHKYFQSTSCPGQIYGSQKDAYIKRAQQWYDYMTGSGSKPSGSASSGTSKPASKKNLGKVDISYALRKASDGKWWDWVRNFENRTSEGYAGAPYTRHDAFRAKVTKGSIKYRVRNGKTGVWTPWHKNGESAIVSAWIDLVEMYYTTPSGYEYQQVWYRAQTTERSGWLPVVCDSGDSIAGYTDENAGWAGEPLDRLQAKIADGDPF